MAKSNFIRGFYRTKPRKVILFIFAVWAGNSLWHLYKEFTAQTPMVHVIAEFDVEGEYVKIDKKIRCYPRGPSGELFQQDLSLYFTFWKSGPGFTSKHRMLGAHLKGGRALLVDTPVSACRDIWTKIKRNEVTDNILPRYFVPSVVLVYDFEEPSRLKYFSSKTAYLQKNAEVTILSYTVRQAPKWSLWDSPDEFNWVSEENGEAHYYATAILEFVPLHVFEKENKVVLSVLELTLPKSLTEISGYEQSKRMRWEEFRTITNRLPAAGNFEREIVPGVEGDEYSVDNFYALSMRNRVLEPDFSQRGVKFYQKLSEGDLKQSFRDQGKTLRGSLYWSHFDLPNQVTIDQTLMSNASKAFYWPKTNRVYRLRGWTRRFYY
ncbi:MAG: hypothetical protein NXI13_17595 [Proteobacteria bacterium]|nr:hypothetical protein [Pseudomonadota bacterium]